MTENELCSAVRSSLKGGKDLALIPYGKLARKVHKILREVFHTEPRWIIDNYVTKAEETMAKQIYTLENLPEEAQDCLFIICSEWDAVRVELSYSLLHRFPKASIIRIQDFSPSLQASFSRPDKIHLDFLGIGFPKCLTSSAYYALRQNPAIFLSSIKENFFLSWNIYEGAHEAMARCFPPQAETEGKLVGDIETSYGFFPERVAAYYGQDLKLLFFLREPSAALFSWFKMEMREVWSSYALFLIKKYGKVCPEMFDEYADSKKWLFCYGTALDGYYKYYDQKNIHIVISEEMAHRPRQEMDTLQAFLGLTEEKRIPVDTLPRINEGSSVVKDCKSAELRHKRLTERSTDLCFSCEYALHQQERNNDPTLIPYKEPMLPVTQARLRQFYSLEIKRVEEIIGRSLYGQWY